MGVDVKFVVGGGEGVHHSSPCAAHGLFPATFPYFSDQIRYTIGIK